MSIALPAADVRDDGPLAHGSRGNARAAALEQLPLCSGDLRGLQALRRGTGCVTAHDGGWVRGQVRVTVRYQSAAHPQLVELDEVRSADELGDRPRLQE